MSAAEQAAQQANGAPGQPVESTPLGMMPSMSPECTPLKHRYDACFNRWFEDYLGLSDDNASASASSSFSSSSSSSTGRTGFWSSGPSRTTTSTRFESSEAPQRTASERKGLRERLEGECGAFWREYQGCVLRAVKKNDLEGLISEARAHNPFPFPNDMPKGKRNNEPFPFPAEEGGR